MGGTCIHGHPRMQKWHYVSWKGALYIQICEKVGGHAPCAPDSYVHDRKGCGFKVCLTIDHIIFDYFIFSADRQRCFIYQFAFQFRANKEYWQNIKPASGRPFCPAMSKPDAWGMTAGDNHLAQKATETTAEEQKKQLVGH